VSRRVTLPGADELFRRTRFPESRAADETILDPHPDPDLDTGPHTDLEPPSHSARASKPSGRIRHDEKITIYVTADELLTLEHTRLALRAQHGVAVDRGRIVREAIHLALQDVADNGDESALVRRLRAQ
jgi:hypothetical protein